MIKVTIGVCCPLRIPNFRKSRDVTRLRNWSAMLFKMSGGTWATACDYQRMAWAASYYAHDRATYMEQLRERQRLRRTGEYGNADAENDEALSRSHARYHRTYYDHLKGKVPW